MPRQSGLRLRVAILVALGLLVALMLLPSIGSAQSTAPGSSYYYTVQARDTWAAIAFRTGRTITELKAANPAYVRRADILWAGDRLLIPAKAGARPQATAVVTARAVATVRPVATAPEVEPNGSWYTTLSGDTWYLISQRTGVTMLDLWHANPALVRANQWLYAGETVWIPGVAPTAAPTETATARPILAPLVTIAPPEVVVMATPVPSTLPAPNPLQALATPSAEAAPEELATADATSALPTTDATLGAPTQPAGGTPVAAVNPAATATLRPNVTPPGQGICPKQFTDYPEAVTDYLATKGSYVAGLTTWLTNCGAIRDKVGSVTEGAIQSKGSRDLVIAVHDPVSAQTTPPGMILVYHAKDNSYVLAGRADASGKVDVLRVADVNKDGKVDIVWTDTTCGAHTCFSTLFVDSWDGAAYRDWIEGEPTMAYPEYSFKEGVSGASGEAILAHGGVIASAGAGPQRAWTETYISTEGAPYKMALQTYDASKCLYHKILDANRAFDQWATAGFDPAIQAYQKTIDDKTTEVCGQLPNEMDNLRDFARFRIALATVAGGKAAEGADLVNKIVDPDLKGAGTTFLESYKSSGSIIQACRDVATYAGAHPASYEYLANWGYANPSFSAADLCPLAK
jgi:LysM repeat protein